MFAPIEQRPETLLDHLGVVWDAAWSMWEKGGWAMIAIAVTATILFGVGVNTLLRIVGKRYRGHSDRTWRLWLEHPKYREGNVGELLDEVSCSDDLDQMVSLFDGIRQTELAPLNRDLRVMKVCIATAPLLGLLGTVTGMLATFGALAEGQGGEKTMAAISRGISEALITTETGLVVALPGLFFHYYLGRLRDRYGAFLAHLETVCTQHLYLHMGGSKAAA